ncbi:MAG: flagellar biosynthetic protein FliO [Burkholderiaceae bacterium]|jgi:flagellar protein FliO/FliZ|nr:flagellar biosynthetic protein FliO [Burkholderiaceae bacterium]
MSAFVPVAVAFLFGALAWASPAVAITGTTSVSTTSYLLQGVFGLLIVLGLMAGAYWLLRRIGVNRTVSGIKMKVVGGLTIGNRERVVVVEMADQWLVLGVTSSQITLLATLPRQADNAAGESDKTGIPFASWLLRSKQNLEPGGQNENEH